MNNKLLPMKMIPSFKDYLWGGDRLAKEFGKNTPMRPLAESWEISCHPDGPSKISTGSFIGGTLISTIEKHPEFVGKNFSGEFPILIKLIDAQQSLSVQVHPDNTYAKEYENQLGKNEMWYVIDALPGSELILGFKQEYSKDEIRHRIENNTILEIVNSVPVNPGDCFEIPAGMLHAIGEGVLVAEVQQSSNVTYRAYDYNRRDKDGNPRELHIDKAIDVIDSGIKAVNRSESQKEKFQGYSKVNLTDWKWFNCVEYEVETRVELNATDDSFHGILVISGEIEIGDVIIKKGESVFIPAGMGEYFAVGKGRFIVTTL